MFPIRFFLDSVILGETYDYFLFFSLRWAKPTPESRIDDVVLLNNYLNTLPPTETEEKIHYMKLKFMAEKGIRQFGEPRINIFVNRQHPEPLHLEIRGRLQIIV